MIFKWLGRLFHHFGPTTAKDLSAILVRLLGITRLQSLCDRNLYRLLAGTDISCK
ncbi:hypothetical protein DPMN_093831 [Dreissena polymorpha]|uniref:Uncharacterized protein n=1 Tax=Dreissena polymorpha TaxID=45954 RepID=A0A9D4L6H8_DREPO|nr:hypothetical protein DPMN_093831 [Dreissena polymorpha]